MECFAIIILLENEVNLMYLIFWYHWIENEAFVVFFSFFFSQLLIQLHAILQLILRSLNDANLQSISQWHTERGKPNIFIQVIMIKYNWIFKFQVTECARIALCCACVHTHIYVFWWPWNSHFNETMTKYILHLSNVWIKCKALCLYKSFENKKKSNTFFCAKTIKSNFQFVIVATQFK